MQDNDKLKINWVHNNDKLEIDWIHMHVDKDAKFDFVLWLERVLKHAQQINDGHPCCEQDSLSD